VKIKFNFVTNQRKIEVRLYFAKFMMTLSKRKATIS